MDCLHHQISLYPFIRPLVCPSIVQIIRFTSVRFDATKICHYVGLLVSSVSSWLISYNLSVVTQSPSEVESPSEMSTEYQHVNRVVINDSEFICQSKISFFNKTGYFASYPLQFVLIFFFILELSIESQLLENCLTC